LSLASDTFRVAWRPRATPLELVGVMAPGAAAQRLALRLLRNTDEQLACLRGVAGTEMLVVVGAASTLPWVDGVTYLGRDERAPALLLPTHLEPDVALPLLESALLRLCAPRLLPPVAVLPAPARLVALGGARPLERALLESWLAGQQS
jgi:hypothetical protein